MKIIMIIAAMCCIFNAHAQNDTSKWLRAFPITDYMVALNDSTSVLQLEMPEGLQLQDKQLGLIYGVYQTSQADAVEKGYGRVQLIKSNYYYFSMSHNHSGIPWKAGDIIYTYMTPSAIYYDRLAKLAGHFIRLLDVHDNAFYDRYKIFNHWTKQDEQDVLDSIVRDIQFTGQYFLQNDASMDQVITKGFYKDQKILYVMAECQPADLNAFLDYIIMKPRFYAGREWKISEIFATWLTAGAPGRE